MKRIYFDYAASTPMAPAVVKAMRPYFGEKFGNAGSLHRFGQEASAALEESREKILKIIGGAASDKLIFTGSATEANNLALRGAIKGIMNYELEIRNKKVKPIIHNSKFIIPRIIISAIEHESVLETCRDLERSGVEVVYLPVSREGVVDLKKMKESLNERTVLVSVMFANNEIGTIQPISELAEIIGNFRDELRIMNYELSKKDKTRNSSPALHNSLPLFHTDAVQALQFLGCGVDKLGVDLMTLSAHKIYGPKGIGALYVRRNYESGIMNNKGANPSLIHNSKFIIHPIITGGGQEFGLRAGTANVAGAVAFAKSAELVSNSRELENERIGALRDYFWKGLKKICPKAEINGAGFGEGGAVKTLPNIINVYFPGRRAQELLIEMDLAGVAVSAGAACSAYASKPSHVVAALGFKDNRASESLRFSFGSPTKKEEINEALKRIGTLSCGVPKIML